MKVQQPRQNRRKKHNTIDALFLLSSDQWNTTQPFRQTIQQRFLHAFNNYTLHQRVSTHPLRQPLIGYLSALIFQSLGVSFIIFLERIFPNFSFPGALPLFIVLLIALSWGMGPGIVATLIGALLLLFIILPPHFSLAISHIGDSIGLGLYLAIGFAISVLASQTQQARYRAEELSRLHQDILDAIPEPIVIYDQHGRSVYLNHMAEDELVGEQQDISLNEGPDTPKIHAADGTLLPFESLPLTRALQGETIQNSELFYTTNLHHKERFISVNAAPLLSITHNHIVGAVTVTRDITLLRQAEQQENERTQQLEALFEAMTDAVFILKKERGTIPHLNRAAWELLGFSEPPIWSDLSSTLPFELLNEDHTPLPYEQWPEKRIREGERLQGNSAMDVLLRTKENKLISLSITGGPLYDKKGQLNGGILVCRDVTERRASEYRIQQSLDALLHIAHIVVQPPEQENEKAGSRVQTVAKQIVEYTRQVLNCDRLSLSGIEPEDELLYPLEVAGLTPEEERAWWLYQERQTDRSLDPTIAEKIRNNEIQIIDFRQPPWNALPNSFHIRTLLVAPISFKNQLLGLLNLDYGGREHTYTKHELMMIQAITQLIALVIERERLLTQQAEAQASLLSLQEVNRLMDEFIGIASHELRTPLTTILASVQLARRQLSPILTSGHVEQLNGEYKRAQTIDGLLHRAERQVGRQNRLVNDMLDISRLHADRLELHLDLCNLVTIAEEVIEDQRALTPERPILWKPLSSEQALIRADADRIRQVIANYLSNAIKYSEADKPVYVTVTVQEHHTYLSVQDEGPGLTEGQQQHIWKRFYRVPGIEVKSGSGIGLGLGLHISRMMIERQGGKVGVKSTLGEGSTFWFMLPLAE